ncbi:MAG: GH1 family beta-glucosidase [Actinobacteria bacterium]|nr:GH1 family beta-glucosidase [Actinomycetota bacterium]
MVKKFRENFIFGVATSSYQIEGAAAEDGKGPSIWDKFCKIPGKTYKGHTGDIACDHYHKYKEDVELMAEIGVDSYRFSISWPRIFPQKGKYNPEGMEFYKKLVNELNKKGIKPAATLYHWDLPLWAYEAGGWLNRDSVKWYEEYAVKVFEELNDSVKFWITHNEPFCASILSYYIGLHAPGHKNIGEALTAAHHILLSHGIAVESFRKLDFKESKIGITLNLSPAYPLPDSEKGVEAASRADGLRNRWFLDPVFKASYPADMKKIFSGFAGDLDFIKDGDLQKISIKNDFLGVNYYTRTLVEFFQDSKLNFKDVQGNLKKTAMDWEICPEALYDLIVRLRKEYTQIPIYITENGAAFNDRISEYGRVCDVERTDYIRDHLAKVAELNDKGADVRGYYIWSLMDSFEWEQGYSKRFGIVSIDYKTQKRVLKNSALWYRDLIKEMIIK